MSVGLIKIQLDAILYATLSLMDLFDYDLYLMHLVNSNNKTHNRLLSNIEYSQIYAYPHMTFIIIIFCLHYITVYLICLLQFKLMCVEANVCGSCYYRLNKHEWYENYLWEP